MVARAIEVAAIARLGRCEERGLASPIQTDVHSPSRVRRNGLCADRPQRRLTGLRASWTIPRSPSRGGAKSRSQTATTALAAPAPAPTPSAAPAASAANES